MSTDNDIHSLSYKERVYELEANGTASECRGALDDVMRRRNCSGLYKEVLQAMSQLPDGQGGDAFPDAIISLAKYWQRCRLLDDEKLLQEQRHLVDREEAIWRSKQPPSNRER